MNRKRLEWLAVAALIAAGAALRFRIGYHWLFAGSDSYGYLKLADQLWQHGRFALSPADPPHLGRMPLYPMFLAVVKREHIAEMSGGEDERRSQPWQPLANHRHFLPQVHAALSCDRRVP